MKHILSRRAFLNGCTLLAASAALGGLTACGGTDAKNSDLPQILIGSDTYPPYIYLNNDGTPAGIDVEIATEAFRRMGYKAQFVTIDWVDKKELVENGTVDCLWGSFSIDGREDEYRWAGPYMTSRQVVAVMPDSDITALSDLEGLTMAVHATTKPEELFLHPDEYGLPRLRQLISLQNRELMYPFLSKGYADAIASHETSVLQYIADYDVELRILDEPLLTVGLGVAFDLRDERGLDEQLNAVLADMRRDGTEERIVGGYLLNAASYLEVDGQ